MTSDEIDALRKLKAVAEEAADVLDPGGPWVVACEDIATILARSIRRHEPSQSSAISLRRFRAGRLGISGWRYPANLGRTSCRSFRSSSSITRPC